MVTTRLAGLLGLLTLAGCLDRDPIEPSDPGGTPELVPVRAWIEVGGDLTLRPDRPTPYSLRVSPRDIVELSGTTARGLRAGTATIEALFPAGKRSTTITVLEPSSPLGATVTEEGLTDASLLGIWSADRLTTFAAGTDGVVIVTRDGGATWSRMPTGTTATLTGIWGSSASDVFAVGGEGTIIHWDGVSWERHPAPTTNALLDLTGFGPDQVVAVGVDVALRYDGTSWSAMPGDLAAAELWSVWGLTPADLFAVGQNGVAVRWDGRQWRKMTTPTPYVLFGLWGTASNDVYAAGIRGTILHFDGTSWSPVPVPSKADFFAISGTGKTNIMAVGNTGTVINHNGISWTLAPQTASLENLRAISFDPTGTARVAGWSGTVIERSPGTGWRNLVTASLLFGSTIGPDGAVYTVGAAGAVYRQQAGRSVPVPVPTRRDLYGIARLASGELVVVGDSGTILSSADGSHWVGSSAPVPVLLRSIWADRIDPNAVYVVGAGGTILRRVGGEWLVQSSPTGHFLRHVFGLSPNAVIAVGDSGTVIRSEGGRWEAIETPVSQRLRGVWGTSADDLVAVGDLGTTLRYDGRIWYPLASGTTRELRSVAGTSPTDIYAVGEVGTVLRFDGSSWEPIPLSRTVLLLNLRAEPGGILTAVGSNRTTIRLSR
jgi:photosystem II stability/assembly factor-like uncharacterized protein